MLRRTFLALLSVALGHATGCGAINLTAAMGPTQKQFDSIRNGMSEREVIEILGPPQKRMSVQGGEGGYDIQLICRWLGSNQIIIVNFDSTGVIGKRRFN